MAQPQSNLTFRAPNGRPILLAQAETSGRATRTDGVAGTVKTTEEKDEAGKIPSASLLFANSVFVALLMIVFALIARRRLSHLPKGVGNIGEFIVEQLDVFTKGIIGPEGGKYTPLVGTVFLYILLSNLIGLIPTLHSPTGNLTITLALGVVVFIYVQYEGIRQSGLGGYLKHFAGPVWWLSPLMFPIELISELVKPFTLAIRLFGNIFGEDVILIVLAGLLAKTSTYLGWIPIQFPVMFLALITALVQAMVFAILTCIYLSLMSHGGHDDEHGHGEAHGNENPATAMAHAHETSP